MSGCRSCRTCTMSEASRFGMRVGLFVVHFCTTLGLSWVVWRTASSRCPRCRHWMGSHGRR